MTMRVYSVFVVAVAVLLSSSDVAADTDAGQIKSKTSEVFPGGVPSAQSLSARADVSRRQRSLRVRATDDADDVDKAEKEEEEERAGGTDIVVWAHKLERADAKMYRQIAKRNSPEHILDKYNVPYEVINGQRVYSKHDPDYKLYRKWLARYQDDPLTFGRR